LIQFGDPRDSGNDKKRGGQKERAKRKDKAFFQSSTRFDHPAFRSVQYHFIIRNPDSKNFGQNNKKSPFHEGHGLTPGKETPEIKKRPHLFQDNGNWLPSISEGPIALRR
jgi:hypothetical protein